ncbi:MAG: hypothetical protein SOI56_04990 [Eubacteriales bacterium]|jgi:pyridoxal biosynthesis lyase PdxS
MNKRYTLYKNLAPMLKGGVILKVTKPECIKIQEKNGRTTAQPLF